MTPCLEGFVKLLCGFSITSYTKIYNFDHTLAVKVDKGLKWSILKMKNCENRENQLYDFSVFRFTNSTSLFVNCKITVDTYALFENSITNASIIKKRFF